MVQLTKEKGDKLMMVMQELESYSTAKERKSGLMEVHTKDNGLMVNSMDMERKPGQMLTQCILENGKLE